MTREVPRRAASAATSLPTTRRVVDFADALRRLSCTAAAAATEVLRREGDTVSRRARLTAATWNHTDEPDLGQGDGGDDIETTRDVRAGEELTVEYPARGVG